MEIGAKQYSFHKKTIVSAKNIASNKEFHFVHKRLLLPLNSIDYKIGPNNLNLPWDISQYLKTFSCNNSLV